MQAKLAPLSPAQYLAWEEQSPVKCEYINGEIYAQPGAKRAHNLIAGNLFARAWSAAKVRPACQVFGSDMKSMSSRATASTIPTSVCPAILRITTSSTWCTLVSLSR